VDCSLVTWPILLTVVVQNGFSVSFTLETGTDATRYDVQGLFHWLQTAKKQHSWPLGLLGIANSFEMKVLVITKYFHV